MPYVELGRGGAHAVIAVDDSEAGAPRRLRPQAYRVRLASPWTHADVCGLARHIEALQPFLGVQYVALAQPVQLSTLAVENALNAAVLGSRASITSCSHVSTGKAHTDLLYEWGLEVPNLMGLWLPCPEGVVLRSSTHFGQPAVVTVEIKPKAAAAVAARSLLVGLSSSVNEVERTNNSAGATDGCFNCCNGKSYWFDPQYDVKFRASRFAMTQVHKARLRKPKLRSGHLSCNDGANERSQYEPADLFAAGFEGSAGKTLSCISEPNEFSEAAEVEREQYRKRRIRQALAALLEQPENNLLVYVNGLRLDWSTLEGAVETQAVLQDALLSGCTYELLKCEPHTSAGIEAVSSAPLTRSRVSELELISGVPPALTQLAEMLGRVLLADGANNSESDYSEKTNRAIPTTNQSNKASLCHGNGTAQKKGGALGALATMQMRDVVDVEGAALLLHRLIELRGYSEADARAEIDALLLFNGSSSRPKDALKGLYEENKLGHCTEVVNSPFIEVSPSRHELPPPPSAADLAALQWPHGGNSVSNHTAKSLWNSDDLFRGDSRIDYKGGSMENGHAKSNNSSVNSRYQSINSNTFCSPSSVVPDAPSRAAALSYAMALDDPSHVAQLLANWLLALAASDASLMLSFSAADRSSVCQQVTSKKVDQARSSITLPTETEAGFLPFFSSDDNFVAPSRVGGVAYCIGMTDVGPKPSSKILAKASKEADFCAFAACSL